MKLIADPGIVDVIQLLDLIDNALADITEGSNVIGKDSDVDAHLMPPFFTGSPLYPRYSL
jgi:hypothetical protein